MAIFNQQGQSVGYQFNGDTFHFDSAATVPAALSQLEQLLCELSKASGRGHTDAAVLAQAKSKVADAVAAAKGPNPNRTKVFGYLRDAANLLQAVASLSGFAGAVASAAKMVWRLF